MLTRDSWPKLVAGGFTFLAVASFAVGCKGADNEVPASLYSELQIVPLTESTAAVAHVCNGRMTHRYDIDRDSIERDAEVLNRASEGLSFSSFTSPRHHDTLLAAMLKNSGGIKLVETSGVESPCDSHEKLALLDTKAFWSSISSAFVPLWFVDRQVDDRNYSSETWGKERFERKQRSDPAQYCPSAEREALQPVWKKVESRSKVTGTDLMAIYAFGKLLGRAQPRDESDPFKMCLSDLGEGLDELKNDGRVHYEDEPVIDSAEIERAGIRLPPSCRSLPGGDRNLPRADYENIRGSEWMKNVCAAELGKAK